MRDLSAQELQLYLGSVATPPLLLDVREPWEYRICRLENSQLVPMGQIPTRLEELDAEREIVVICHHGIRSAQVGRFLERQGFTHVVNLRGGLDGWAHEVDKDMPIY